MRNGALPGGIGCVSDCRSHSRPLHVAASVQRVVVVKPEAGAMKLVRSTSRDRIENRAGIAAILGAELIGDQSDFLNRVRIIQGIVEPATPKSLLS